MFSYNKYGWGAWKCLLMDKAKKNQPHQDIRSLYLIVLKFSSILTIYLLKINPTMYKGLMRVNLSPEAGLRGMSG